MVAEPIAMPCEEKLSPRARILKVSDRGASIGPMAVMISA